MRPCAATDLPEGTARLGIGFGACIRSSGAGRLLRRVLCRHTPEGQALEAPAASGVGRAPRFLFVAEKIISQAELMHEVYQAASGEGRACAFACRVVAGCRVAVRFRCRAWACFRSCSGAVCGLSIWIVVEVLCVVRGRAAAHALALVVLALALLARRRHCVSLVIVVGRIVVLCH